MKIENSGVYALINFLPSLFPRLGHGLFLSGVYLRNNPVSSEVKSKLEEELKKSKEVGCHVQCHAVLLIIFDTIFSFSLLLCHPLWLILREKFKPTLLASSLEPHPHSETQHVQLPEDHQDGG